VANKSQQLRQSFLVTGTGIALALVVVGAVLAGNGATTYLRRQADDRGRDVATRAGETVTQYLRERRREAQALATSPAVVAAARAGTQEVVQRKLDKLDIPTLERLFAGPRALGGDADLTAYLRSYLQRSDFSRVFFTESHGYNVITTSRSTDFVQSDEAWWQTAVAQGEFESPPQLDSATNAVSIEFDVAIRPAGGSRPLGVLKAVFGLDRVLRLLAGANVGDGAYVQVADERGNLVVTPDPSQLLHPLPEAALIPRIDKPTSTVVPTVNGDELVIAVPTYGGRWWTLFRQPTAEAYAGAATARRTIWFAAFALLAVTIGVLWGLGGWLNRRVTEPVRAVGAIASRVAAGDLSVTVARQRTEASEVNDLLSAVHSMVVALRRLVGAIRSAADEAAAMASEISASTEEMSASTEEMTATCQDLSRRAGEQSQLVRQAADDATKILDIVTTLAAGAAEAARRNNALAVVARSHKDTLDQSTAQLSLLVAEVDRGASEAEALAQASTEIQRFVTQAKAVATQTNTLALNAAIEAARAGPQGRGFAVVADEVRKLASQAATSAGETSDIVRGVLGRVQATRDRLQRLAQGGATARAAAESAAAGLASVASEAETNDAWSGEIAASAEAVQKLVQEIAGRLGTVAKGTDDLLAAAEEIAASSQEQSASTQEIASSANQLATAADNLTGAVQSFRLLSDAPIEPQRESAD
jgi:methyl-accepting chemotaxis protein